MINCEAFSQRLSDMFDGEISDEDLALFNAHRVACPSCAQKFGRIHLVTKSIKKLHKVYASKSFDKKLRKRIEQDSIKNNLAGIDRIPHYLRSIPVKPMAATLAAAAIIVFVVMFKPYFSQNEKTVITPQIQPPQYPRANQSTLFQQNMLPNSPLQIGGFYRADSSSQLFRNRFGEISSQDNLIPSWRDQIQQIKENKH